MHEIGLCDAIFEAALRRAGGRRVSSMRVRVSGHAVDPDVIDQGLRMVAAGTPVEGARVEIVTEPLSVRCDGCGGESAATDARALAACARCGGVDVRVVTTEPLVVESITFEEPAQGRA